MAYRICTVINCHCRAIAEICASLTHAALRADWERDTGLEWPR